MITENRKRNENFGEYVRANDMFVEGLMHATNLNIMRI